jgi:hypothetical protein
MPSPQTSSSTSSVGSASVLSINSLLGGDKWGGATGTGGSLSYSFPWTSSSTAIFSGHDGVGDYSSLNEQNASSHYGLSTTQQVAARAALQSWANVANLNFSEVADSSANVGDIRFGWTSATDTTSTGNTAWGWATFPNAYWPSAGDVWISTLASGAANTNWAVGSDNFGSLIHELGHALGLKHPFEGSVTLPAATDSTQYSLMAYTPAAHSLYVSVTHSGNTWSWSSYNIEPSTPMLYDIQAMQYLYGANTGYNTGDNTYTFDPAVPFIKTLWDAGGKDTISVSNFTLGCTIDLRPGSFSKVSYFDDISAPVTWTTAPPTPTFDGTDDLAIAYGCVIENAIGGSGNDTLTGNDVNNSLDGGAGNDSIDGGAGIDTAVYSMGRASVSLTKTSTGFTLTDNSKVAGTDTLQAMERIKFSDAGIALDVASTQAAGQTVMLLGAVLPGRLVFDKEKQALLGAAIDLFDQGYSLQTLSGAVMRLPIWDVLTQKSAPTSTDIATYLLNNVNGAAPDATTLANAVTSLNTETDFATQGNFLWHLAESAVNQTRIDLVGLAATGLVYTV